MSWTEKKPNISGNLIIDDTIDGDQIKDDSITGAHIDDSTTLTVTGLTVDTDTLYVDYISNKIGVNTTSPTAAIHSYQGNSQVTPPSGTGLFIEGQYSNYLQLGAYWAGASNINFGAGEYNGVQDFDSGRIQYSNYSKYMDFQVNASSKMRISSAGYVGIGTTTPSRKLTVKNGSSGTASPSSATVFLDTNGSNYIQMGGSATGNQGILFGDVNDNDVGLIQYNHNYNYLRMLVNASERLRIDSSGRVLIGTTSAGSYAPKMRCAGRIEGSNYVATTQGSIFKNSGNYGVAGITLHSWSSGGTFSQKIMSFQNSGTTEYGSITIAGTTTSYNTSSDERLKENIKDAEDAGDKIDAIKIRQFDWKENREHEDYGVIAQELLPVAPEAVSKGENEDDMMAVDYSKLVPTLIKEIQALRKRVEELEKE